MSDAKGIIGCIQRAYRVSGEEHIALHEAAENGITALEAERDALRVYAVQLEDVLRSIFGQPDQSPKGDQPGRVDLNVGPEWVERVKEVLAKNPNPVGPSPTAEASGSFTTEASGAGGAGTHSEFETDRHRVATELRNWAIAERQDPEGMEAVLLLDRAADLIDQQFQSNSNVTDALPLLAAAVRAVIAQQRGHTVCYYGTWVQVQTDADKGMEVERMWIALEEAGIDVDALVAIPGEIDP